MSAYAMDIANASIGFSMAALVKLKEDPEPEEENEPQEVVYFCFVALLIGAVTMHFLSRYLQSLPYTVMLLIEGLLLGVLHSKTREGDVLGSFNRSMEMWSHINPELLLYVFLPALLFGECMTLRWHLVRKTIAQCLTLACPGVLVGCFLTAAVAYFIFPYNWPPTLCLTFGAILAATDPVAVVAILKELGASPKLTMIICGEALLNDGTAIVVTLLFKAMALVQAGHKDALHEIGLPEGKEDPDFAFICFFFFKMAICAAGFGICTGVMCSFLCSWAGQKTSHGDTTIQIAACLCTAYLTFYIGDHIVGVSGVLATVVSGVVVSALAWPLFNDKETMKHVWHMFEWIGNTLIFVLAGLVIGSNIATHMQYIRGVDFLWLLVLYAFMNAIRFLMVFMFFPGLKQCGYGLDCRETIIMAYGGLRGAVGLALALDVSLENWNKTGEPLGGAAFPSLIVFHVGGIAVLTVLINGVTGATLLRLLGMTKTEEGKVKVFKDVKRRVKDHCKEVFDHEWKKMDGFTEEQKAQVKVRCSCLKEEVAQVAQDVRSEGQPVLAHIPVREFFLSSLKAAYAEQISKGVLRQDGPQEMILKSSISWAEDNIQKGIMDWEYVKTALVKPSGIAAACWRKTLAILTAALTLHEHRAIVAVHDRTCIYILTCYIQAHKEAQETLKQFLHTEAVTEKAETIQASEDNVMNAQSKLQELFARDQQLAENVEVQQISCVVLESERRYVEELVSGGVLDDSQAHDLFHRIEHDVTLVRRGERDMKDARSFLLSGQEMTTSHT